MNNLLHLYAQDQWHSPALIIGQRQALQSLVTAIQTALAQGQGKTEAFVNDGEGYELYPEPYTAEILQVTNQDFNLYSLLEGAE